MEVATPEQMAYFRSQQASDDADREFGAPPKGGRPRQGAVVEPVAGARRMHEEE
ncbi:MAG: hypothetical protein KIT72_09340 [Polyangiaceae bacterium]|nr:hypothetical protein [Polyangiaceae bacterium]MCW5790612.1 hypothetical protein [Polyangiaceae bacterium]